VVVPLVDPPVLAPTPLEEPPEEAVAEALNEPALPDVAEFVCPELLAVEEPIAVAPLLVPLAETCPPEDEPLDVVAAVWPLVTPEAEPLLEARLPVLPPLTPLPFGPSQIPAMQT
jgi:hypothetical protein